MSKLEDYILREYPAHHDPENGKRMSRRQLGILSSQLEKSFSQSRNFGDDFVLKWILYFDTLPTPVAQRAACKWFCNQSVTLPEDEDKILQAVHVAKVNHVDPLSYDYPMAVINAFGNYKRSGEPIDPARVPTLHLQRRYKCGIDIYDVDDNDESRINMRSIINTHWGVKSNPWCLLQGDEEGNLTQESGRYWEFYNGFPKRVAFKDSRLYAFSAGTGHSRIWWDRNDRILKHKIVKYDQEIENDPLDRRTTIRKNTFTGETTVINIYRGSMDCGSVELYRSMEDKEPYSICYYLNGERISLTKGWKGLSAAYVRKMMKSSDLSQGIVHFPEGISHIPEGIMVKCAELKEIYLPDSVESIGDNAFAGCTGLRQIHLPSRLKSVGDKSFQDCRSLISINLPDTVESIGKAAFSGCSSLREIRLPDSIKSVHDGAFSLCTGITRFYVPNRYYPVFCERYGRRVHFLSELHKTA